MERLREALLASRTIVARQEAESLLSHGSLFHELLAGLYFAASHHFDGPFDTASGLYVVYNLDRMHHELRRLDVLDLAVRTVIDFLARTPKSQEPVVEPSAVAPNPEALPDLVRGEQIAELTTLFLGLEDRRREEAIRAALLDWALTHLGRHGNGLIFVNAFLHAIERGGRVEREHVAAHAARLLVTRERAMREMEACDDDLAVQPPLPGSPAAGVLLQFLREFHAPAALACVHALCQSARHEEAMTVLLLRAEENAGSRWEHLLLADAVREILTLVSEEQRRSALRVLTARLSRRSPHDPLVENLGADPPGNGETRALTKRERDRAALRAADAIARRDLETSLEAARVLLHDETSADELRRILVRSATTFAEERRPHVFLMVMTCLAIARRVGWPAARTTLLRAVFALVAETDDPTSR